MSTKRGTDCRSHTDIHTTVAGYHDECEIIFQTEFVQLAAALAFPEHFDDTGHRCRPVLEQVVDER
ncbi:hypothetical protein D3C73_1454430 [compost metagenome]